ncbi:putative E3 ubiquitin-protein ligase HUL5 [Spathaspora sp. JA1]|nr:putative E3 ubiquitin-protein ligase HUL5 [Spathaspora sp. JA1]
MLNFSGSSKRRVVNLGDRKKPVTSHSFLEQSKLTRIQRDQERTREKSAIILQRYITRYLHLTRFYRSLIKEYLDKDITNDEEFVEWLKVNIILCKWYFPRHGNRESIALMCDKLTSSIWSIPNDLIEYLFQTLVGLIGNESVEDKQTIFHTIKFLYDQHEGLNVKKLTLYLYQYLSRVDNSLGKDHRKEALDMIYTINIQDSFENFMQVLKLSYTEPNPTYLKILRPILATERWNYNQPDLIQMLASYLSILGDVEYTHDDFIIIGNFLENVECTVRSEEEPIEDADSQETPDNTIYVSSAVVSQLEKLYSSNFLKTTINLLTSDSSGLGLGILVPLSNLLASFTGKIPMFISIIPGCFDWLYRAIKEDKSFKLFTNYKQDYIVGDIDHNDMFWELVLLFQKSYSYWLIVSNDLESFAQDKLSLENVKYYLKFLRTVCLTLVFRKKQPEIFSSYSELKKVSIGLLNQLYLKNLRLKFLNQDFWIPSSIKFDIDTLIRLTAEEELEEDTEMEGGVPSFSFKNVQSPDTLAKLEILKSMPYFISFKDRVRIFQALIELDRGRNTGAMLNSFFFSETPGISADIRRDHLLLDAFTAFNKSGHNFKNRIQVQFYNEYGKEAGIDGGGITKEFLTSVVKEGFNPENEFQLFKETIADNQLYPNNDIYTKITHDIDPVQQQVRLQYLRFLGMIIGKCLYENVLIDISFAPFFLNKWCNMKNSINDLNFLDNELFINLMKLTKMSTEELQALDLNFTIIEKVNTKTYSFDLLPPNGAATPVTSSNILQYIHQLSNFKLNQSLTIQTRTFLSGLFQMISSNWLNMFDCFELQMLISGEHTDVNIDDWKSSVEYGGYLENDLTIKYFWQVVEEMTIQERFKLMKFVTSVGRVPLLGFGSLNPKFGIRNSGSEINRLPTTSTCVNLLKLPDYRNKQVLKEKLLYVINIESGFDLS